MRTVMIGKSKWQSFAAENMQMIGRAGKTAEENDGYGMPRIGKPLARAFESVAMRCTMG